MDVPRIVTIIFLILIIAYTIIFRKRKSITSIANIVTTIGILGTFMGISWGLYNFDVDNIQGSISGLLDGMKFAMLTSIFGIFTAILIKSFPRMLQKEVVEAKEDITIETLANLLNKQIDQNEIIQKENKSLLENIEKSLTGDGESTLLTQIQKLRTTFTDKQDDLIKEFKDFSDKIVENNADALIEALTKVMKDFNTKINEQFGENFKKLNEAMGKILEWQVNYKEQIDHMIKMYEQALSGLEKSVNLVGKIVEESEVFEKTADHLKALLEAIATETDYMEEYFKAIREIVDKATESMPVIKSNLEEIIKSTSDFVKNQSEMVIETQNKFNNELNSMATQLSSNTKKMMEENKNQIEKQIAANDAALKSELNNSLASLGSALTSLSKKFVEDYTPLTDELRKVVQMAKELEKNGGS